MSRPHCGVGSDGLILILPSDKADFKMRMFNSDGSESPMCGNGARCVGRYVYEYGLTKKTRFTLETGGGIREIFLNLSAQGVQSVTVDMGAPQHIQKEPQWTRVSMGNPHAVIFLEEDPFLWPQFESEGPRLCSLLNANIEFIQPLSPGVLKMRVWERGSGETLACGTGACASTVAAFLSGRCGRKVAVVLGGGTLSIEWREEDDHLLMTGPAEIVFEGRWPHPISQEAL